MSLLISVLQMCVFFLRGQKRFYNVLSLNSVHQNIYNEKYYVSILLMTMTVMLMKNEFVLKTLFGFQGHHLFSLVSIATELRDVQSRNRVRFPLEVEIVLFFPAQPTQPPTQWLPQQSCRGLKLTTHLCPVPRLRIHGTVFPFAIRVHGEVSNEAQEIPLCVSSW